MEQSPLIPQLLLGRVWHKRCVPVTHAFAYPSYHIACPLDKIADLPLARQRWRALSFNPAEHGPRTGAPLRPWAHRLLGRMGAPTDGPIILVCALRVFGYVFNPVSFWLCLNAAQKLRAVICEVNNTFGETHSYVCAHADARPIAPQDIFSLRKKFHVSPFFERQGYYRFRFAYSRKRFSATINYHSAQGRKLLMTSLQGQLQPASPQNLRRAAWRYPFASFLTTARIHWHALQLWRKGVPYIPKPKPLAQKVSR